MWILVISNGRDRVCIESWSTYEYSRCPCEVSAATDAAVRVGSGLEMLSVVALGLDQ